MKLCIDCKHIREPNNKRFEKCSAPKNLTIDPVAGVEKRKWVYCESLRMNGPILSRMFGQCGQSGRWFEKGGEV